LRLIISDLRILFTTIPPNEVSVRNSDVGQTLDLAFNNRWPKQLIGGYSKEDGGHSFSPLVTITREEEKLYLVVDDKHAALFTDVAKWLDTYSNIKAALDDFVHDLNANRQFCADAGNYFPPVVGTREVKAFERLCASSSWRSPPMISLYNGKMVSSFIPTATTAVEIFPDKGSKSGLPAIFENGKWRLFTISP
jgi:hypothetical protein